MRSMDFDQRQGTPHPADAHEELCPQAGRLLCRVAAVPVNADAVLETVLKQLREVGSPHIHLVVCDLSASPFIDLAGSNMLHELHSELTARGIALRIAGAHRWVRDLLRADGLQTKVGELHRAVTLDSLLTRGRS